ncbi:hypothetical protein [Aliikangiella sp. IMCC44359]|uniref:hypothetical protein n=1 Tax=Aliikangiella sp. IMCC44359 TaxID=3459125 RepID=UPI00403AEE23
MQTPVGSNSQMTQASVKAKISAYQLSKYESQQGNSITMTHIPKSIFEDLQVDLEIGTYYQEQYDHMIKMAVYALQESLAHINNNEHFSPTKIPLILSMPEPSSHPKPISAKLLTSQLIKLSKAPIDIEQIRYFYTGRAAVIDSLSMAHHYFEQTDNDYVLIGGSDSYHSLSQINLLDKDNRLLTEHNSNGFAPGEGAGFLLITRHKELALKQNNSVIEIHPPGIAKEAGHLYSFHPHQASGLDDAFKQALKTYTGAPISTVYSSMNGEHFWAKEYGVAMIRNSNYFSEDLVTEHPADCYGDLGTATGSVLIGLSSISLLKQKKSGAHLVYSSSDRECRAAVCLEKVAWQ